MSTIANQRLQVQSGELSAEAAEQIALAARAEFADTAEAEGRRAALKTFNLRVSWWANQFTDKRLKRFAWTLGTSMRGETHSFRVSVEKLRRQHQKLHPDAYLNKATGNPRMLSKSQILRYLADLEEAEIIEVIRERQDESGDCPGAQKVNVYTARFDRVIRYGSLTVHDFMAADQRKHSENDTRDDTRDDTRRATRDDTLTCSSSGSSTSSATASSSPLRGQPHDDDAVARRDSGKGPTARVGGGTAREDPSSAGNRGGSQASSAAPPDGAAPAAGSASRENRDELERKWAEEVIADLNEYMAEMFKPYVNPSQKLILQLVTQAREHSTDAVCQAILWCFDGYSEHRDVTSLDNPAGFLTTCLPGIVSDYVMARERQARELEVEDRAGFDLYAWLRDQEEMARQAEKARAEREAQEELARQEAKAQKEKAHAEREAQAEQDRQERAAEAERERAERKAWEAVPVWELTRVQIGPTKGQLSAYTRTRRSGWWCRNHDNDEPGSNMFVGTEEELLAKYPELTGQQVDY